MSGLTAWYLSHIVSFLILFINKKKWGVKKRCSSEWCHWVWLTWMYSYQSFAQSCPIFVTAWTTACQASLSITNSWSLLNLRSIESAMRSNHLILCHPLLLPPSIFPSNSVFSNESALHIRWPKTGASTSASVLPMNIQDWFPFGLTGWISLQSKGISRVFSNTTVQKHQFFSAQLSLWSNSLIHTWPLEKP